MAAAVSDAGFGNVDTYQAAGNLIVDPGDLSALDVETQIEGALERALGYTSEVFVRTPAQIAAVLDHQPFEAKDVAVAKPQIAFLRRAPVTPRPILDLATPRDHLAVNQRELHWLPLDGVSQTTLDLTALGRLVAPYTVRGRSTVQRIHAKYFTD